MLGHKKLPLAALVIALGLSLGTAGLMGAAPGARAAAPVTSTRAGSGGYLVRMATFNILASTMKAGGRDRARRAARALKRHRSRVVSLQEVAGDQLKVLMNRMPGYGFWPRRTLGPYSSAIQIAWHRNSFKLVRTGKIYVPVRGKERAVPWARLKDRGTDRHFFVIAIHNSPGSHEKERDVDTAREIELIRRKQAVPGHKPVFALGDVNEKVEFCRKVARHTGLVSMYKGTAGYPCPLYPKRGPDWMMGTDYCSDYYDFNKIYNGISDHPLVVTKGWIRRDGC